jgi:TonB-dependent receptor
MLPYRSPSGAPLRVLCALFLAVLLAPVLGAQTGSLAGTVSNTATGNNLEGARIEIARLGLVALSDNSGRYVLAGVPAGDHEVLATYIGLDPVRVVVSVGAGASVVRNFEMTTGIYKLEAFKVTGEREGNAAMITEKKNASNVKDIISMDSFGYLPNMSAGEVVMRLPGVAGSPTDEGLAYRFNMRGMDPALNNVTVDGASMTTLGTNRSFELQSITGAMFEALELIKGHTPDKGADSLGGTINFKTRSTFSMKERRRTTFNFSTRYAPPFLEQTPLRSQHRAHPILNVTHQEVLDVFGDTRNLGVSLNLFYSENAVGGFETIYDYTNILNGPAPVWNYQTWDNANNRKQMSVNFKADYRWSPTTKFTLGLVENDNFERHRRRVRVTASTGSNTQVPGAATALVPGGFTDKITTVRPVAATNANGSNIDVQMDGPLNYYVRMHRADFSAEHNYKTWLIEYGANAAQTTLNSGQGKGGQLNMRLNGVGWILDRTQSELHPKFIQNGGPDFTNPANYRPRSTTPGIANNSVNDGLTQQRNESDQVLYQARLDVRHQLPWSAPNFLKFGWSWRSLDMEQWGKDRHRWGYVGTGPLPEDSNYVSYDRVKTGRAIPIWQSHMFTTDGRPTNPALWREDMYYHFQQQYTGTNGVSEAVTAYYLMAQGRFGRSGWLGRTGYLGGVRFERTDTSSWGWVRARRPSTAAEQLADPKGAADRDYANTRRDLEGSYQKRFPSIHAFHDVTPNLKARLSWSTSYGRPALGNLLPGESIDENNRRLTVNNPGLKPQTSTNWDATLEYYFEPVGSLTVGWFHKEIKDFIIANQDVRTITGGLDNGYDGEYEGWTERTSLNGGTAVAQGWEFAYSQQFTFLPGVLKGLAASFNYTWIDTHGLYTGSRYLTRNEVAGFIPHAANASLTWRYGKFNTRVLYNFTGEHITAFNATNAALSQFRLSAKTLNLGFGYQARPALGFTLDVANALNEPQQFYIGYKDRMRRQIINFVTITAGVNGRF